jgi:hypothetical protein
MHTTNMYHLSAQLFTGRSSSRAKNNRSPLEDREEGLHLMHAFLSIQDATARAQILRLVSELANAQPSREPR